MSTSYPDFGDVLTGDFQSALNCCCPLCGDILEWSVSAHWSDEGYILVAKAESCGIAYKMYKTPGFPEVLYSQEPTK